MLQTLEPPLADLGLRLITPGPPLRPYVKSYWCLEHRDSLPVYREEFMHPRGGFGIVFNFGDAVFLNGQPRAEPVFLDGSTVVSRRMGLLGNIDLLGINFHEGGAYPFVGVSLAELRNEVHPLDVMDRALLLELYARLAGEAGPLARINRLEEWLLGRLLRGKPRDSLIPASLALLRAGRGVLTIPALTQQLAVSQRHLERLYQTQVGISPKQYSQLVRVETARLSLKRIHGSSMTRLANDLGYSDQSHFIREFSAVVGMTPTAYRQRSLARRNSLDESGTNQS